MTDADDVEVSFSFLFFLFHNEKKTKKKKKKKKWTLYIPSDQKLWWEECKPNQLVEVTVQDYQEGDTFQWRVIQQPYLFRTSPDHPWNEGKFSFFPPPPPKPLVLSFSLFC